MSSKRSLKKFTTEIKENEISFQFKYSMKHLSPDFSLNLRKKKDDTSKVQSALQIQGYFLYPAFLPHAVNPAHAYFPLHWNHCLIHLQLWRTSCHMNNFHRLGLWEQLLSFGVK